MAELWGVHIDLPDESGWIGDEVRGEWPLPGIPQGFVVYELLDDEGWVVYIGQTRDLAARLSAHARSGKEFAGWTAQRVKDRETALDLEECMVGMHAYFAEQAGRTEERPRYNKTACG